MCGVQSKNINLFTSYMHVHKMILPCLGTDHTTYIMGVSNAISIGYSIYDLTNKLVMQKDQIPNFLVLTMDNCLLLVVLLASYIALLLCMESV